MKKHPIIILEGADGTGKTTLAKAIDCHYIHCTYKPELVGNMTGYFIGVLEAAIQLSATKTVVIDRWRMSEIVYGKVFRKGPEQPSASDWLFDMAQDVRAFHVFCHPGFENKEAYLKSFDEMKKSREEMYDTMTGVYVEYGQQFTEYKMKFGVGFNYYDRFSEKGRCVKETAKDLLNEARARL